MSDEAVESVGDKSTEISLESVPSNLETTASTTDAVAVDSTAKQTEDLLDTDKGQCDNGDESLSAAGDQLGKGSDIADVSGDSNDFVMVSSTEEIDAMAVDATLDANDDVKVTDVKGKETEPVDAVVDVNKMSVESVETSTGTDESKSVSSSTETGQRIVTEVDTDSAEPTASEVVAVVSEVTTSVTVSEAGNVDTSVSDTGVGAADGSKAVSTGVTQGISNITETDKATDSIAEATATSVGAQEIPGVIVATSDKPAVGEHDVSQPTVSVSEPAVSEHGVGDPAVGERGLSVGEHGVGEENVSEVDETTTVNEGITSVTTSVTDTSTSKTRVSKTSVDDTGVGETAAARTNTDVNVPQVHLLPAVSATDIEVRTSSNEISARVEHHSEPVAAAAKFPAGLESETEIDTIDAVSKMAPVSHLEPTIIVKEETTSKKASSVSHVGPGKAEEEVSLKVAPASHTEPTKVEEEMSLKVAPAPASHAHTEPTKAEEEVSLKEAPVSHTEPSKAEEKVASKVAPIDHPEPAKVVEEQILSKEAPVIHPTSIGAADVSDGSHRKVIHIEPTSFDDSNWNKSMEEPEYEFDDLDIHLAGSPVVTTAAAAAAGGVDEVTGYEIGASEPIDELAEEAVEQEFEEDFEEQLGTHQTDENDPELAYRDIAKFSIVQVAGDDSFGRKVIVFSACNMPPRAELDHQKLLGYLRHTLDQYVENDYTLVYFHHGLDRRNKPSFSWLRQAYGEFDRKYKKNLKALYVVHPTTFIKVLWNIFRPFISVKFGSKLMYLNYLHELAQHIQLDQIIIPPAVRDYDAEQLAKNKPRPVPVSIIHAPLPTQQFGVELEFIKRQNGGEIIPPVIQQCVAYLRTHGLETEGIFRRCANIKILRQVQDSFNQGVVVDLDKYGDVQIPAAIVKSFLRQLPEPILTYDLYDHIIHVQSMEMDERLLEMRRILTEELPPENYYVLKYVVQFLTEVFANSDVNRMTVENLAIVFGPNLLWSKNEATLTLLGYVHSCAALLISHYDQLFTK